MFLGARELSVCHCKCVHDDGPIILPSRVIGTYFTITTTLADVLHTHLIIDANTSDFRPDEWTDNTSS